ncbi:unnamed protein product [Spirodela intermedia]|uniref:Uncharacterized protein n=1 Tax=Spirodela intermedia TaxID=51605 RepID=A0A7I8K3Z3_SPIIN|nr:unnamed protein product [Spirodela intermedia]
MGCCGTIPSPENSSAVLLRRPARAARASPRRLLRRTRAVACLGGGDPPAAAAAAAALAGGRSAGAYSVDFRTLAGCKLGISRYPDFDYDASGGTGTAAAAEEGEEILVTFDAGSLYIPPLMTATTRFLGLPLPPFLKIEIVPENFQGIINRETGQVDLDFRARFWFSVGRIYRAPPLLVETRLTSEESKGSMRGGRGRRLDGGGACTLVGVATVAPVDDFLMDSFLRLPTECIAQLNARISISATP